MTYLHAILASLAGIASLIVAFFYRRYTPPTQEPMSLPPTTPSPVDPDSIVYAWDTPAHCYHNTRVLCDKAGLTLAQKNVLSACVYQESNFLVNPKPNTNKDPKTGLVWSTDYGIVQINDYFHIGPGKDFPSVAYVLANPGACVQYMVGIYASTGALEPWASYTSGAYEKWLAPDSPMWLLGTPA